MSVLILTGLLLLVDGGVTLLWQEPVTAAIALIKRSDVSHKYLSYRTAPLTHTQRKAVKQIHTSKPADLLPGARGPGADQDR